MISKLKDKNVFSVLFTVSLFILIYLLSKTIPEENLRLFILSTGDWGPLVYVFLMLFSYILAPLSGSPLLLVGFYIFHSEVVLFASIAGFFANITNFWIARLWGRKVVKNLVGSENIKKIDDITKNSGLVTLFFVRIFQGGIHEFISYALGLTSMKFLPYFVISALSMIPGSLLWYFLALKARSSLEFTVLTFVMGTTFSGLLIVFILAVKKIKKASKGQSDILTYNARPKYSKPSIVPSKTSRRKYSSK